MSKVYHNTTMSITARPRSKRLREAGGYYAAVSAGKNRISSDGQASVDGGLNNLFEEILDENNTINGTKSIYDIFIKQVEADERQGTPEVLKNISEILRHLYIEDLDGTLHLRSDISFYSDGFISAGGISDTEGGTGGGIAADAMWQLLAGSTPEQIDASHLTTALAPYATTSQMSQILAPYATKGWVLSQGFGIVSQEHILDALGYAPVATDDLLPMTEGLARVSARVSSLEDWLLAPSADELVVQDINVTNRINLGGMEVEYDAANNAWHLKGNIYADGFISAGGISDTEGGSGGGIDLGAMWTSLVNEYISPSHVDNYTKIAIDHIPDVTVSKITDLEDWWMTKKESISPMSTDVMELIFSEGLARVSARVSSLEDWLLAPSADELVVQDINVTNRINLGGMEVEYDAANNAWHLKGNIYADGYISAGGISDTEGGSGGGIAADAMWQLLADATPEQINASHLPPFALASDIPARLASPFALSFGSKSYDGSAARTVTAADLGALTSVSVVNNFPTLFAGSTVTLGTVQGVSITARVPSFALASDIPTRLASPHALSFGNKSYDGSAARTITAADLGALTSVYTLTVNNAGGTAVMSWNPASANGNLTITKSVVGLGNVENIALSTWSGSSYITNVGTITTGRWQGTAIANAYLENSGITIAGRTVTLGGSISQGSLLSDIGLSNAESNISTLQGYFTGGVANSALRLSGTASRSAWGRSYWSGGIPADISGPMSDVTSINGFVYFTSTNSRVGIGTSSPTVSLDVRGAIRVTTNATVGSSLYLGDSAYLDYRSAYNAIHCNVGLYSDGFVSAGGVSTTSDARLKDDIQDISTGRAWEVIAGLRPVTFRWRRDGACSAGFVAQEAEQILPEAVTDLGGVKRLQYDILFTYGMAALSGLRLQQETQEKKIARLERRVRKLEKQLLNH